MLNWNVTRDEHEVIVRLADRAVALAEKAGVAYRKQDAIMDITACHANGCPLQLVALNEAASESDLAHDLFGIRRHINRETGALEDCFLPRYAEHR